MNTEERDELEKLREELSEAGERIGWVKPDSPVFDRMQNRIRKISERIKELEQSHEEH